MKPKVQLASYIHNYKQKERERERRERGGDREREKRPCIHPINFGLTVMFNMNKRNDSHEIEPRLLKAWFLVFFVYVYNYKMVRNLLQN